jgi:tRNA threonylcarbamoyladenosine modification (KEOPS) complex Cgi121 subunit
MPMETLLYTATQHQIRKAIQIIGLKPDTTEIAITILSKSPKKIKTALDELSTSLQTAPCETVLDLTPTKINQIKQTFNITNQMIETITKNKEINDVFVDLLIEKIALMATKF